MSAFLEKVIPSSSSSLSSYRVEVTDLLEVREPGEAGACTQHAERYGTSSNLYTMISKQGPNIIQGRNQRVLDTCGTR